MKIYFKVDAHLLVILHAGHCPKCQNWIPWKLLKTFMMVINAFNWHSTLALASKLFCSKQMSWGEYVVSIWWSMIKINRCMCLVSRITITLQFTHYVSSCGVLRLRAMSIQGTPLTVFLVSRLVLWRILFELLRPWQ